MFRHHFFVALFITMCLYLILGLALFYSQYFLIGSEQKNQEKIITMSLISYELEVIPPVKKVIEVEAEPEPIEEIIPEEVFVEEPVVEDVLPEPIIEKIIPKPIPIVKKTVKKVVKKKVKIKKKKKVKKVVKKKKLKKKRVKKVKPRKKVAKTSSKKQASPAQKNAFYAKVRAKIKRYKTYPRIAQRRGMQGSVKVNFTILRNGHVSNIKVSGKKVFYKSARAAIKKAFPMSTKNLPVKLPTTVNLTLRYQLR